MYGIPYDKLPNILRILLLQYSILVFRTLAHTSRAIFALIIFAECEMCERFSSRSYAPRMLPHSALISASCVDVKVNSVK